MGPLEQAGQQQHYMTAFKAHLHLFSALRGEEEELTSTVPSACRPAPGTASAAGVLEDIQSCGGQPGGAHLAGLGP